MAMGRKRRKRFLEDDPDMTKPCRCGTGFYCHQHLQYGLADQPLTPKLMKSKRPSSRGKKTGPSETN